MKPIIAACVKTPLTAATVFWEKMMPRGKGQGGWWLTLTKSIILRDSDKNSRFYSDKDKPMGYETLNVWNNAKLGKSKKEYAKPNLRQFIFERK